jgi:lysophospholipase L1-like esterase
LSSNTERGWIVQKRTGTKTDPFVPQTHPITVVNGKATLDEIPNKFDGVTISNATTTLNTTENGLPDADTVVVNYNTGELYFDPVHNGTQFTASYVGTGFFQLSARRVFTESQSNPDIVTNVQDMIDNYNNLNGTDLYEKFDPNVGHLHSGEAGDGTKIPAANIPISDASGIIDAFNVEDALVEHSNKIGVLTDLTTTEKGSLVGAVNEVTSELADEVKKDEKNKLEQHNVLSTLKKLYRGEPVTIVNIGTSLSFGSGASWDDLDWNSIVHAKLQDKFPMSTITWQNSGVGGSTSSLLYDDAKWAHYVSNYNPNLIIIDYDTNDNPLTNEERERNFKYFVDKAKKINAELLFITNSTSSFTPAPYGNTPDTQMVRREEIAEQTRGFARKYKVGLIDSNNTWRKWLADRQLTTDSTLLHYDHIHPNDLGHKLKAYDVMTAITNANRELDEHFGGKNYNLFGKLTFRDVEKLIAFNQGYSIYDFNHQLVDWGGLWTIKDYKTREFKKAKLNGTQAVTGDEPYQNNYQDFWHIIPIDKDYVELEVKDAKKVWVSLTGDSATATDFEILVDGVIVKTVAVSNASNALVEVPFNTNNFMLFRKGTHKVRVQRLGSIPSTSYILFGGFIVKHYKENEPEQFTAKSVSPQVVNVTYSEINANLTKRQDASDIGVLAPFGYAETDPGFVQFETKKPVVGVWDFYGDKLDVAIKNITSNNFISIYIDDVLKETVNFKDTSVTLNTRTYIGLGANKRHTLEIVAGEAQVNLQSLYARDV